MVFFLLPLVLYPSHYFIFLFCRRQTLAGLGHGFSCSFFFRVINQSVNFCVFSSSGSSLVTRAMCREPAVFLVDFCPYSHQKAKSIQ
ncbi:hypothetical protein BDF21DRAFT_23455 [Thamnidium elegans]|nr:hypothetical protein BDF21DRAFT_23455 [Thamnidium elegans]